MFVKAITTIRALSSRSNYGSLPRPPAENRIKLYGLYKQAVEGNVENVMPRPIGFTLEDEGAKKKWDAWKREQGLSRTEAKRQYISYLIETMRVYASGTLEARELLSELEYLWDQIKDLQYSIEDDENPPHIPIPAHSPLFSQSDRYSNATPLPLPSNYSASVHGGQTGAGGYQSTLLQQYRNNLQKIYSHSRRNTVVSINDYVQQQRQLHSGSAPPASHNVAHSVYSVPGSNYYETASVGPGHRTGATTTGAGVSAIGVSGASQSGVPADFKQWQGEINTIINKLSREFLNAKSKKYNFNRHQANSSSEESLEIFEDPRERLRRRVIHIFKLVGSNLLKLLKNFTISLLAILFITWCIKRNVLVKRTIIKEPLLNSKTKKELVINMVLNMDENKWFIRLLSFVDSFVGFS